MLLSTSVRLTGPISMRWEAVRSTSLAPLVAFCPGTGTVTWFDLEQMRVTHEIRNSQANPFWVSPVFAADGNTLYLHEGGTGALAAVDLIHARIEKSARVAMAGPGPLAWLGSLLIDPAYAGGI